MTQEEIATRYGIHRGTVNKQIKTFKQRSLIVNSGNGWYEFDAALCWRGNLSICRAYQRQQRVRNGRIVTDGTTTLVAPDMDADDEEPCDAAR